jgi:ABC-type uncharacterized transport system auxiliary subunit
MKIKIFFWFGLIFLISGCIHLKDEYPKINYYTLIQEPTSLSNMAPKNVSLVVRDLNLNETYAGVQLLAHWEKSRIQKYFYHRWINDFSQIATDFLITRFDRMNVFQGGVSNSTSAQIPDYILEGNIIDLYAQNNENIIAGNCFVNMEVSVTFFRRNLSGSPIEQLFTKNYSQKTQRRNNDAESIPDAFSKSYSMICDQIIVDVNNAVELTEVNRPK